MEQQEKDFSENKFNNVSNIEPQQISPKKKISKKTVKIIVYVTICVSSIVTVLALILSAISSLNPTEVLNLYSIV